MQIPKTTSFTLSEPLKKLLVDLGYHTLTPIQQEAIGPLLEGKDIIGQAKTGSGKTAAFSIPMLERMETGRRVLQFLVLCPTRELCTQVTREMRRLGRYKKDLFIVPLIGGEPFRAQMRSIQYGAHVVVGTPGRILDHLERKTVELSNLKYLVLDEADRMLDMGFRDAIEAILAYAPKERQTALFSATFPGTIETLSKRYQKTPVRVSIKDEVPPSIDETLFETSNADKMPTLLSFLQANPPESAMVFCNTKVQVEEVFQSLRRMQLNAERLHGDLEQNDRQKILSKFRNKTISILVATDVAARGIDITQVEIVINFDLPSEPQIYLHRIGRTGRAGKSGRAIAFLTPMERPKIYAIESYLKRRLTRQVWDLATPASVAPKIATIETLYIGGGRKQKIRPTDILGALTQAAGLKGDAVGKIEIHDNFSYVAVNRENAVLAIEGLKKAGLKGRRFSVGRVA